MRPWLALFVLAPSCLLAQAAFPAPFGDLPQALPSGAKPWLQPAAAGDDACWETVDITVAVRPRKLSGERWDGGLFGVENPDIKAILLPLPARTASPCQAKDLTAIHLPHADTDSAGCGLGKDDEVTGFYCADSLQVRFNAVRVPRVPLHIFLLDVDLASHDLIFEHQGNRFAHTIASLESTNHRGQDTSCEFRGKGTTCRLRIGGVEMAIVQFGEGCADAAQRQEDPAKLLPQLREQAFAAAPAGMPGDLALGWYRVTQGFAAGRDAAGARFERDVENAVQICSLAHAYSAALTAMLPVISSRGPAGFTKDMRPQAEQAGLIKVVEDKVVAEVQSKTLEKFGQSMIDGSAAGRANLEATGQMMGGGNPRLRELWLMERTGRAMLGLSRSFQVMEASEAYRSAGMAGLVCQLSGNAAQEARPASLMLGILADCAFWRDLFLEAANDFTARPAYRDEAAQFVAWVARRTGQAAMRMGYSAAVSASVQQSLLVTYDEMSVAYTKSAAVP